jgi:hypothetical protein
MDLKEIGSEEVNLGEVAQERVQWQVSVVTVMNTGFHDDNESLNHLVMTVHRSRKTASCTNKPLFQQSAAFV